jgi:hypothetical protein
MKNLHARLVRWDAVFNVDKSISSSASFKNIQSLLDDIAQTSNSVIIDRIASVNVVVAIEIESRKDYAKEWNHHDSNAGVLRNFILIKFLGKKINSKLTTNTHVLNNSQCRQHNFRIFSVEGIFDRDYKLRNYTPNFFAPSTQHVMDSIACNETIRIAGITKSMWKRKLNFLY